eukprot:SAG11_NODE_594_length_8302_cov_1.386810_15_plen_127_part_00
MCATCFEFLLASCRVVRHSWSCRPFVGSSPRKDGHHVITSAERLQLSTESKAEIIPIILRLNSICWRWSPPTFSTSLLRLLERRLFMIDSPLAKHAAMFAAMRQALWLREGRVHRNVLVHLVALGS